MIINDVEMSAAAALMLGSGAWLIGRAIFRHCRDYKRENTAGWASRGGWDGKMHSQGVTGDTVFECACCGKKWTEEQLVPVGEMPDLFERCLPGETFPYGGCPDPECGAFCFPE